MDRHQILRVITLGGYYLANFSAVLFVLAYSFLARWWRTEFGRHVFIFMLVIALVMTDSTLRYWFGNYHGFEEYVSAVLFSGLGLVVTWRVIILLSVQWKGRKRTRWEKTKVKSQADRNA